MFMGESHNRREEGLQNNPCALDRAYRIQSSGLSIFPFSHSQLSVFAMPIQSSRSQGCSIQWGQDQRQGLALPLMVSEHLDMSSGL